MRINVSDLEGYITKRAIDRDIGDEEGTYEEEWHEIGDLVDYPRHVRAFLRQVAAQVGLDEGDIACIIAEVKARTMLRALLE